MKIPDKNTAQMFKLLNQSDDDWNKQQNILIYKKILEKLNNANNQSIDKQVIADLQVLRLTGEKY